MSLSKLVRDLPTIHYQYLCVDCGKEGRFSAHHPLEPGIADCSFCLGRDSLLTEVVRP